MADPTPTPAESMEGIVLDGGWTVTGRRPSAPDATGGTFSVCWHVQRDGEVAFMKAIDIRRALRQRPGDAMQALERVARDYNHELNLLKACAGRGMNRVVRALDHGEHQIDPTDELSKVFYLIFEIADDDLRGAHSASTDLQIARIFSALHDVAVGINQLHSAEITHQDLKPSNVLVYSDVQEIARLADLGRASVPTAAMPHDELPFAGAIGHAPPEGLYGSAAPDWAGRRACDLYHLGSILLFLFTGISATAAWVDELDLALIPKSIGGPFRGSYEAAMPFVRNALQDACEQFPDLGDPRLTQVTLQCFRELCDPDPALRGHPRARQGHYDRLSTERYIALFDLEAKRAGGSAIKRAA